LEHWPTVAPVSTADDVDPGPNVAVIGPMSKRVSIKRHGSTGT
jgi:hypothetical protein